METFSVSGITKDQPDASGVPVTAIYARYDPRYAVYRTRERVSIQFADDPQLERTQRASMARLSPLRGEVNGLIDGWRGSSNARRKSAAMRYDRRVADALILAFEADAASALVILRQIRDDIVAERKSRARFLYLVCAALAMAAVAAVAGIAALSPASALFARSPYAANAWLAISAGALGAFFSIARGISGRSIHTDLQMSDNIIDAVLRVLIGAIAALVLQALLDAGLFSVQLGSSTLGASTQAKVAGGTVLITAPMVMLVAGFIAGFSERLVPDLLNSANMAAADKPQTAAPTPAAPTPEAVKDGPEAADGGHGPEAPDAGEPPPADPDAAAEEDIDGCEVDPAQADVPPTPDDRLPAASGGVAGRQ